MAPPRGLSRSAIRKKQTDTAIGTTRNASQSVRRARYPISQQQPMPMIVIRAHAATGMRFSHAAWLLRCELVTSFMPETRRPIRGAGTAAIAGRSVDQSSVWSRTVSAVISDARPELRVV